MKIKALWNLIVGVLIVLYLYFIPEDYGGWEILGAIFGIGNLFVFLDDNNFLTFKLREKR